MTYEDIRAALDRAAATDPQLRSVMKRIREGKATFRDTAAYAQRFSVLLGDVFSAQAEDLSPEEREAVCKALLRGNYDEIGRVFAQVQERIDEENGLHLTAVRPAYPTERVDQLAHSLLDPGVQPETIRRRAQNGAANVSQSFHDDLIAENAKIRSALGLKCYLVRETDGSCCKWCDSLAGRYVYGSHPGDIFRRHDNCTCTVTYENGRERQDVWSKRTWDARDPKEVMRQAEKPVKLTQEQAERLQENALQRLTLAGERDIMNIVADPGSIYHEITNQAIDRVPMPDLFEDVKRNRRHQEASKALLREAQKYAPGVEVSAVYDADMKPIEGFGYVIGKKGHVRIDNPGVPFHAIHNHGSGETLSFTDMRNFVNNPASLSITAVGNTGSVYSLARSENSDSLGYGYFLHNKSKTVIFSANGVNFTLEKIADKHTREDLKPIVDAFSAEQRKALAEAILSQIEKCLRGGAKYGFQYTKISP